MVRSSSKETNNTDESNDDSDVGSEEGGSVLNEDRGDRQVEFKRDDEAAEEERDDQEAEEEDDEGEDTQSVKTYVKSIIPFDDDDERNPHATSSPKGNITIMLHIIQSYCCTILYYIILQSSKYNPFYFCTLQLFRNFYANPSHLKMSRQINGFN